MERAVILYDRDVCEIWHRNSCDMTVKYGGYDIEAAVI
jgi:hypothetical protein